MRRPARSCAASSAWRRSRITALLAARNQRGQTALREHASLLDLTHDTIFVRDRNDVITYWNRAATELYGWRRRGGGGPQGGRPAAHGVPASLADDHGRAAAHRPLGGRAGASGRAMAGMSRWRAAGRCNAMRAAARSSILETNNDVTEQRAVEDGLHRARSELAHVSRMATLGELTASIAHEVNQPLAAIVDQRRGGPALARPRCPRDLGGPPVASST